jgi:hypothetical protein
MHLVLGNFRFLYVAAGRAQVAFSNPFPKVNRYESNTTRRADQSVQPASDSFRSSWFICELRGKGSEVLLAEICADLWILRQYHRINNRTARMVHLLQSISARRTRLQRSYHPYHSDRQWPLLGWRSGRRSLRDVVGREVWKEKKYTTWMLLVSFGRRASGWSSDVGVSI